MTPEQLKELYQRIDKYFESANKKGYYPPAKLHQELKHWCDIEGISASELSRAKQVVSQYRKEIKGK